MNNIDKLEKIFPECITEAEDSEGNLIRAVDFVRLKQILSDELLEGREAYEFNFVGKKRAALEAHKKIRKTLRPLINQSRNFDTTQNLYIEGDNLQALKILAESYLGKVKMIYIDPPYNVGADAIYRDDFTQDADTFDEEAAVRDDEGNRLFTNKESCGRFHSDWCAMIYSRLLIAKHFLSDDGVIFISIDDHEQANLKKICDEVFGEKNFVACIAVINNFKGRSDDKFIATAHENLLIYRKENFKTNGVPIPDEYLKEYTLEDEHGKYRLQGLRKRGANSKREDRPNMFYPFFYDEESGKLSIDELPASIKILPYLSDGTDGCWRWGKDTAREKISELTVQKVKRRGEYDVFQKDYLPSDGARRVKPKSFWSGSEFSAEAGTLTLKAIMGKGIFSTPKSLGLVKYMLQQATDKDSIVMDFFSGSATTAHAVMELNAADGGQRKFIMIQIAEATPKNSEAHRAGYETICEIGKERIRRAGDKLKAAHPNLDTGFRVFKVADSNFKPLPKEWTPRTIMDFAENIKADRNAYDLFFEALLDTGMTLDKKFAEEEIDGVKVLSFDGGKILASFEKNISASTFRKLANRGAEKIFFRDASFASSSDKINALDYFKYFAPDTKVKVL